ncbi:MAG: hypothetical protein AAGL68_00930, partial [Pseudomonadota bacterium]
MRRLALPLCAAGFLSACGGEPPSEQTLKLETAKEFDLTACERNAQGQIACLRDAFALAGCQDLKPIGTMHKDG